MATIIKSPILCTFIHIPKTGGNSITVWMTENFQTHITKRSQHATVDQVKEGNHSLGPIEDLGWKFCVVRNPWDYMVSWYTFKLQLCHQYIDAIKKYPEKITKKEKWNLNFQQQRLERLNQGFNWWVKNTSRLPQHHWAKDCDYVMKLENINEDFTLIQTKLNCQKPLQILNKTQNRSHYKDYYTQETIDIVAEKYAIDIDAYGYQF